MVYPVTPRVCWLQLCLRGYTEGLSSYSKDLLGTIRFTRLHEGLFRYTKGLLVTIRFTRLYEGLFRYTKGLLLTIRLTRLRLDLITSRPRWKK